MTKKTTGASTGSVLVRELADILDDTGLVELEYATDDVNIRLSRASGAAAPVVSAPVAPAAPVAPVAPADMAPADMANAAPAADHPGMVPSPMVGTVYLAPEPGADNFIKVGDSVKAGQTLLIIEAMKVMNPITAPAAGKVSAILVDNAQPVEYGEALVIIE
ncbi:MAG: acetyl-CoA carboxylase biotin carboxyl carrier protein [Alphaproteobacteria bacterium]|nr:acetyl-CoA carboxylase biotin carboxyl carrier protein [Alphaproteobacteria bacterium]